MNKEEEFRKNMRVSSQQGIQNGQSNIINMRPYIRSQSKTNEQTKMHNVEQTQRRFTSKKGAAQELKRRKKKKKLNLKVASLVLATAIGMGTIATINSYNANKEEPANLIEMEQEGVNPQNLGLSEQTIASLEKYDEYFDTFNENDKYSVSEEEVISMISEIRGLHFSVIKEKMGALLGEDPNNITMYYGVNNDDGVAWSSIILNENKYNKQVYSNDRNWILPNKNTIPNEIDSLMRQLDELSNLISNVQYDKITKINAIKELQKLYNKLEYVATGDFIQDEKGNISIIHYERQEQNHEQEEERED